MSPPIFKPKDGEFSRRSFIALTGVTVAASVAAVDIFGNPLSAAAAVTWGHPFSYREVPGSGFGPRNGKMHEGQDYPAPLETPIYAVADGVVAMKGVLGTDGAYGNAVYINHSDGWSSRYAHMVRPSTLIVGTQISRGGLIGYVGSTGNSTGPHLHIELRINGTAVDPLPYIQNAPVAGGGNGWPSPAPTLEDNMIRISSPSRGTALIGPGYFRQLTTQEEIDNSSPLTSASFTGNDRQFDLWKSMVLQGEHV
ncbi:M23 family metallopeptidase [Microbacterium hydrocarbonoxydans]|uniref:M23 family metallopeptidase n=1 Tax=Microbacterium hydrocarbonoxydans TaxID=273678 RepID=UPI003D975A2F